jgi:hypothetical protein
MPAYMILPNALSERPDTPLRSRLLHDLRRYLSWLWPDRGRSRRMGVYVS